MRERVLLRRWREQLLAYDGTNRILVRWKENLPLVLAQDAPEALGAWMLEALKAPQPTATDWKLDPDTPFFIGAVRASLAKARGVWGDDSRIAAFACDDLLGWRGLPINEFKEEISDGVLHRDAEVEEVQESLKKLLLGHPDLGDPRLPANKAKWLGVRDEARRRFNEWLSRADIKFFFDHAFLQGGDRQGRKRFWLEYVPRIRRSRPLLCRDDGSRLKAALRELGHGAHSFGEIDGSNSAFLLDFGSICAVEFSRTGGACYLYETGVINRILPEFYGSAPTNQRALKRRSICITRIVHRVGWEDVLRDALARRGVRP